MFLRKPGPLLKPSDIAVIAVDVQFSNSPDAMRLYRKAYEDFDAKLENMRKLVEKSAKAGAKTIIIWKNLLSEPPLCESIVNAALSGTGDIVIFEKPFQHAFPDLEKCLVPPPKLAIVAGFHTFVCVSSVVSGLVERGIPVATSTDVLIGEAKYDIDKVTWECTYQDKEHVRLYSGIRRLLRLL
ncbi:MAG: hypothetical protein WC717_00970 [Candidatus Micrarchaeia archaeon]|jgi:hypothetical protein